MKNFLHIPKERVIYRDDYFFIIEDGFPVSPGHILIISNEHRKTYFDLTDDEALALPAAIRMAKSIIESRYDPEGFNIGMNCGEVAGQSVMHFHCHVIPRYEGDMINPKGGVRHVIPEKGSY